MPEGTSIMHAAMEAGIQGAETLGHDSLNSFGSCRLCLVEIEGRPGTPASCTTLAAPGMKVHTAGEKVRRTRRGVMELYISDHPLDGPARRRRQWQLRTAGCCRRGWAARRA